MGRSIGRNALVRAVRAIPIRWRILSIAALNSAVVLALGLMIWQGAIDLGAAWRDVRQVRESDRTLVLLESQTGRLQNMIHRYIVQPSPELFAEILLLREAVLGTLTQRAARDPALSASAADLEKVIERFLTGFGEMRVLQAQIAETYSRRVLDPAKDIATLYSLIEGETRRSDAAIFEPLKASREAFTALLVAANAYYLSPAGSSATDARRSADDMNRTIPLLKARADSDAQREAVDRLDVQTQALREGLAALSVQLSARAELLRNTIDTVQADTLGAIESLSEKMSQREQKAQETFDRTLDTISRRMMTIGAIFLIVIMTASIVIALSIRLPLQQIMAAMRAIMAGDLDRVVQGTAARDEIGAMARAVDIFRENAIAKRKSDNALVRAKEDAESALLELNAAQRNLIDAERLAALGGLVAGVAHEVNNPIGISITVASSLQRRVGLFEAELRSGGPLRRSQLEGFVNVTQDAVQQLSSNLHRAGELIQSFKQVAVDRSQAERREFNLSEATDQIVASLRPVLRRSAIDVDVNVPQNLVLDGYPGSYGQILTNLVLNAVNHAFAVGDRGTITITARSRNPDQIEITFSDNGAGMSSDVQRQAFDPFFTTRRNEGGTGLGLHIVYTLVTQQFGGHMMLDSRLGSGTTFRIVIPRSAAEEALQPDGIELWTMRTMSSS